MSKSYRIALPVLICIACLFGGAIDDCVAKTNSNGINWYLSDRLGSVTGITDATGALISATTYDSYGHILSQSNPAVADQLAFTGREFDAETGLYYFRARYYNPDLGRFQSEDPIQFRAGDVNVHRYVFNNPLSYLDPSGLGVIEDYEARQASAQSGDVPPFIEPKLVRVLRG